jgi:hypothetical protein
MQLDFAAFRRMQLLEKAHGSPYTVRRLERNPKAAEQREVGTEAPPVLS